MSQPQSSAPLWLKLVTYTLVALGYMVLPLALVATWADFRNGPPTFSPSWILGGMGAIFILMTWASPFATALYGRNVSGMFFVGNIFLALALLLGPKPLLTPLAFALDPMIWAYGLSERKRQKHR